MARSADKIRGGLADRPRVHGGCTWLPGLWRLALASSRWEPSTRLAPASSGSPPKDSRPAQRRIATPHSRRDRLACVQPRREGTGESALPVHEGDDGTHVMLSLVAAYAGRFLTISECCVDQRRSGGRASAFSRRHPRSHEVGSPNWQAWAEYECGVLLGGKRPAEAKRGADLVRSASPPLAGSDSQGSRRRPRPRCEKRGSVKVSATIIARVVTDALDEGFERAIEFSGAKVAS